ncbi:MAG: hypothetical protein AAFX93_19910 [Verrucomicrobiota bacterium]
MIDFVDSPQFIHLWRDFYLQTQSHRIEVVGPRGDVKESFESLPKITDRASVPELLQVFVDPDWLGRSADWHDGCDRSTFYSAFINDFRFARFAAAEMRAQQIRWSRLRGVACFVAVRLGWRTGFKSDPPPAVYQALEEKIRSGEVPITFMSLIPDYQE